MSHPPESDHHATIRRYRSDSDLVQRPYGWGLHPSRKDLQSISTYISRERRCPTNLDPLLITGAFIPVRLGAVERRDHDTTTTLIEHIAACLAEGPLIHSLRPAVDTSGPPIQVSFFFFPVPPGTVESEAWSRSQVGLQEFRNYKTL